MVPGQREQVSASHPGVTALGAAREEGFGSLQVTGTLWESCFSSPKLIPIMEHLCSVYLSDDCSFQQEGRVASVGQ